MGFIYYIYHIDKRTKELYIGQDSKHSKYDWNNRIFQHAKIAYGLEKDKVYGSERMIQKYSLSNIGVYIDDLSGGYWQQALQQFEQYWEFIPTGDNTSADPLINFAEMASLVVYNTRDNLKLTNVQGGGYQSKWICKKSRLLSHNKLDPQYQKLVSKADFEDITIEPFGGTLSGSGVKMFAPQLYQIYRLFTYIIQETLFYDSNKQLLPAFINVLSNSLTKVKAANNKLQVDKEQFKKNFYAYISQNWNQTLKNLSQSFNNPDLLQIPEPKWNFSAFITDITNWMNERLSSVVQSSTNIIVDALQDKKNKNRQVFGGVQRYELPRKTFANTETLQLITNSINKLQTQDYLRSPFGQWLQTLYDQLPTRLHHDSVISQMFFVISYDYFKEIYNETTKTAKYPVTPEQTMSDLNNGSLYSRIYDKIKIPGLVAHREIYVREMTTIHLNKLNRPLQLDVAGTLDIEDSLRQYRSTYETYRLEEETSDDVAVRSSRNIIYYLHFATWNQIETYQHINLKDINYY